MTEEIYGERVGRQGRLAVGTSAAIFDSQQHRLLLQQRSDNGAWCVPGGSMEAGESLTEACAREVFEETGLQVVVKRLISVFSDPHWLLRYPDGNQLQAVIFHFEAEAVGGELRLGEETIGLQYYSQAEMSDLTMHPIDHLRIADSFAGCVQTIIHDSFKYGSVTNPSRVYE
jgi:8-oxo-dGTP pyrophosphatase MutT (NUDIX family)